MPPKNQTQRIDELLGGVTEELLLGNPQQFEDNSIRVERLLLEMVRPDPVQPRRVLPEQLHFAFHSNRLTPTQALKELVQLVQVAARQRGRPFNNVLELLPNPDDESDEDLSVHLSPEEQLLHHRMHLRCHEAELLLGVLGGPRQTGSAEGNARPLRVARGGTGSEQGAQARAGSQTEDSREGAHRVHRARAYRAFLRPCQA